MYVFNELHIYTTTRPILSTYQLSSLKRSLVDNCRLCVWHGQDHSYAARERSR